MYAVLMHFKIIKNS